MARAVSREQKLTARAGFDFSGELVLVTGILGGLGQATARAFSDAGATVVGIDRETSRTPFRSVAADITDERAVAAAFDEIANEHGRPGIVINNAGIREVKTVLELTPEEWRRVVDVNLNGAFFTARQAAASMVGGNGGCILNIASVAGLTGIPSRPAYNATKHAIIGLTKNLAVDLAPYGIRVNAVAPGTVRTPLTEAYYSDSAFLEDFEATVPLGATGTPEDIANALLFLASPLAAYITGAVLPVDGGFTATKSYSYGEGSAYTSAGSGSL